MSTAQQNYILGTQIRAAAKRAAQTYFFFKLMKAQADAAQWANQFPNDTSVVDDGSVSDGRPIVQSNYVRDFITSINVFIAYAEGTNPVTSPPPLTTWLRIAVNPEQI